MSDGRSDPRAGFCPRCGALNGADFDRCIRCGAGLSPRAAGADLARGQLDGRSLLGTKSLVAATAVVFALQMASAIAHHRGILGFSARDALRFGALVVSGDAAIAEPWRLISAVFVHYGLIHVVMNMIGLVNLGRIAEPAIGTARFVVAYLVTGVAGFAGTVVYAHLTGGAFTTTAGASGAVLGIMGVVLGWLVRWRDPRWKQWAIQAVFYTLLFGFVVNASNVGILVNNTAHLVGLSCGTIFGAVYASPARRSDLWVNLAAGVAIAAGAISLVLSHLSTFVLP